MSDATNMYLCTTCGSPSVEYSALVGGTAHCKACGWKGSREELSVLPVQRGGILDEQQMLSAMYNDFRRIFAANAKEFAQFLVKWGFVEAATLGGRVTVTKPENVVQYINIMFFGAFKSVIELREKMEKEAVRGRQARGV